MRNCMLCNKSSVIRGSIIAVLLLTLFTMMSFTTLAHDQNRQGSHSYTVTSLQNAPPSGTANVRWNPQSKVLIAILRLSGLQPGSNHAAHIHTGNCSSMGKILYPFKNVVANASGNGTSVTTIKNVTGGIPAMGWNIIVHSGPTAQASDLLCGNVVNPKKATSISVPLRTTHTMHEKVGGHH